MSTESEETDRSRERQEEQRTGQRSGRGQSAGRSGEQLRMSDLLQRLTDTATVRRVYGDPVEASGRTVIPVARVMLGYGGGYGSGQEQGQEQEQDQGERTGGGEGWGTGGGASATPVGALEVSDQGTTFIRFDDRRKLAGLFLAGVLVGMILRRR